MRNKILIAIKSTNAILFYIMLTAIADVIGYPLLLSVEAPLAFFPVAGEIFNKLSYSFIAAFIFYFLTQRVKYAEDKLKYSELLDSIIIDLKKTFSQLIHQLLVYGYVNIDVEKINSLEINQEDYDKIISSLNQVQNQPNIAGMDEILVMLVGEFQKRYNYYINKAMEYKEYYSKQNIEIIMKLSNKQYLEIAKHINRMGPNLKLSYLKYERDKFLAIQSYLKLLKTEFA